jgi:hypothetical protein
MEDGGHPADVFARLAFSVNAFEIHARLVFRWKFHLYRVQIAELVH